MKLKQLLCITAITTSFTANADFLSISAGGGGWNQSSNGNFQKTSDPAPVDLNDNLFWDDETQGYLFVTFEHFVPLIPNFRLMHTKLDQTGNGNTSFDFDGKTFSGPVNNNFNIETLDLLAYYEVLDNIVSLDIGLNIRQLKADYTIVSANETTTDTFDETVPMLYALVGASPWPDLIFSGEVSYVAFSGSTVSDMIAKVAYTTDFFVGFEAGYRKQKFQFDDVSGTDANLNFDGVFAGAYLKF